MKALHGVLERAGTPVTSYHDQWTWKDAVPPHDDGSQNVCRLWGLEAMVTAAAMLTESAAGWMAGPLGELDARAKSAHIVAHFMPWLYEHQEVVRRMLTNMTVVEKERVAYGARQVSEAPGEALAAVDALLSSPSEAELTKLRSALTNLAPRPVAAGFYKPGAAGSIGQFLMHLREDGLCYEEIATIVGDLAPREAYRNRDSYKRQRASILDAVKHRINGEKRKLRQRFGTSAVLGGDDRAENLPRHERWVVLVSIRVEALSTATIHI